MTVSLPSGFLGGLSVFEMPGIGTAVVDPIRAKDHNLMVAIPALAVLFVIALMPAVDLLHAAIDPRLEEPTNAGTG